MLGVIWLTKSEKSGGDDLPLATKPLMNNGQIAFNIAESITAQVPVYLISEPDRPSIHRFYDTSPISPSGRYLAYTALPFDDKPPSASDQATVVIADLQTGDRHNIAATTAWDTQVGAHVQWGATDKELFFNVRNEQGIPLAVHFDVHTNQSRLLEGPIYMISQDGTTGLSPNLEKIGLVQLGYGLRVSDLESYRHVGAPDDDGVFTIDIGTGQSKLLLSLKVIHEKIQAHLKDSESGGLYGFHVKWHPDSEWALIMVRWLSSHRTGGTTRNFLLAYRPRLNDLRLVLGADDWGNGHHPNWWSTELKVIMNLPARPRRKIETLIYRILSRAAKPFGLSRSIPNGLRFTSIDALTGERRIVAPKLNGSGHPSIDPSGRFIVTDAYPGEPVAYPDGRVPIRLINIATGHETHLMKLDCKPTVPGNQNEWRIDPHPAWSRCGRYVTMNASINGVRSIVVADVSRALGSSI